MAGRRSHPRFAVANPWEGAVRILRDVVVDRTSRDEVMAVSQAPGVLGETMTLDLMGGGMTLGLRVKVIESRPVIIAAPCAIASGSSWSHRQPSSRVGWHGSDDRQPAGGGPVTDALDALLGACDLVAVLGREVVVRLMDISSAGCLLESTCRLEKGATGLLRVRFEDAEYMDDVRVMRCQESEGGSGLLPARRRVPVDDQPARAVAAARHLEAAGAAVRSVTLRTSDVGFEVSAAYVGGDIPAGRTAGRQRTQGLCKADRESSRCQAPILASQERSAALGYDTRAWFEPRSLAVGWSHRGMSTQHRLVERRAHEESDCAFRS